MKVKYKITLIILILIVIPVNSAHAEAFDIDYEEIFESHRLVRLIIEADTGAIVKANQKAVDFYGYPRMQLLQKNISEINTLSLEETEKERRAAAADERNYFNFKHKLANGDIRNVEVHSYPFDHEGEEYLYSLIIDVTSDFEMAQSLRRNRIITFTLLIIILILLLIGLFFAYKSKEKYKRFANHDPLTGAYSRLYLDKWKRNNEVDHKDGTICSIIILDINQFKSINDQYGHVVGDKVLKKVANILKDNTRQNDFIVRFGGDEFLLVLKDSNKEQSQEVMERIKNDLKNNKEFDFPIEISFGIEEILSEIELDEVIKIADKKMYNNKVENMCK